MWRTDCSRTRSSLIAAVPSLRGPERSNKKHILPQQLRQRWWKKGLEVEPTTDTRKDRVPLKISRVFLVEMFIFNHGWSSTRRAWRYTSMDACLLQKSIKGWDGPYPHSDLELRYTYLCVFFKDLLNIHHYLGWPYVTSTCLKPPRGQSILDCSLFNQCQLDLDIA